MNDPAVLRRSVCLVEDDDAVRRSLQLLLQARGYEVRAYPSAVGLAQAQGPRCCHCIIADLMMPQTDALQLLAELHAEGWTGKSFLISGYLDSGWETKARAAGFDAILPKPLSDSVLIRTLEDLLPARPES